MRRGRRGRGVDRPPSPSTDLRELQLDRLAVVAGEVERFDTELADEDVAIARAERLRRGVARCIRPGWESRRPAGRRSPAHARSTKSPDSVRTELSRLASGPEK